jgi:hypothetical protein
LVEVVKMYAAVVVTLRTLVALFASVHWEMGAKDMLAGLEKLLYGTALIWTHPFFERWCCVGEEKKFRGCQVVASYDV